MSRKMNHAKITMQKRVQRESRPYRNDQEKAEPKGWELIAGKYKGMGITVAQLPFKDIGYFYYMYGNGYFRGWAATQAMKVAQRIRHIRPIRKKPDDWEFIITLDRAGKFLNFRIVRKRAKPRKLRPGQYLSNHLNLAVVSRLDWAMNPAKEKMMARLKESFFDGKMLTRAQCEAFFNNDKNFDLGCGEYHRAPVGS